MCGQGLAVNLRGAAGSANALGNVEDDACETVLVDENLLGVGDLPKRAVVVVVVVVSKMILSRYLDAEMLHGLTRSHATRWTGAYLTSANCSGRSHSSAPPNSLVRL